ncbi:MAG TPA: anti-sigma regulatory factor [Actinomycetota bacterium]|nr:anti-sigma regulatory factor [Actinomycetota bacterium]
MDTVSIKIPAAPAYLQVVRLVAAGLASRLGFTIDEIEDLKIAVDELSAYLTGPQGRRGTLEIDFTSQDGRIQITGCGRFPSNERVRTELTELSQKILETVADEASLEHTDGVPTFRLLKKKAA